MLVAGALGTLVGGRLVDRVGRRRVLVGSVSFQVPLLIGFMLAPSYPVAAVLLALIGFVTVMSFSVSVVMGQEYLPSRLGIASGVTLGFAIGVGGVAAALLGLLADAVGLETVMWVVALCPLVNLVLALILPLSAPGPADQPPSTRCDRQNKPIAAAAEPAAAWAKPDHLKRRTPSRAGRRRR